MKLLLFAALLCQTAIDPSLFIGIAGDVYTAVTSGEWWAAAAAAISGISLFVRWKGPSLWKPLGTLPGMLGTSFVLSFALGLVNAAMVGAEVGLDFLLTGLRVGFAGAGGAALVTLVARLVTKAPRFTIWLDGRPLEVPGPTITGAELRAVAGISDAFVLLRLDKTPPEQIATDTVIELKPDLRFATALRGRAA